MSGLVGPSAELRTLREMTAAMAQQGSTPDAIYSAVVAAAAEIAVFFDDHGMLNPGAAGGPDGETVTLALLAYGHYLSGRTVS